MSDILNIYTYQHKPLDYSLPRNENYKILQVGAAHNKPLPDVDYRDNEGDNISLWNEVYVENTGLYWVWKNRPESKYVGVQQYRRQFPLLNDQEAERLFEKYDCITTTPLKCVPTVWAQFCTCHGKAYIQAAKNTIENRYPLYKEAFEKYIEKSPNLLYAGGYVMKSEDFDTWCEFAFAFASDLINELGCCSVETVKSMVEYYANHGLQPTHNGFRERNYDVGVVGFMFERLWTMWCQWRFDAKRVLAVRYVLKEKIPF